MQRVRQSLLGQMVTTSPCPRCGGLGTVIDSPCPTCRGEGRRSETVTYTVDVPPGIDAGSTLRLNGRGAVGPRGGGMGDLYVHVRVRPHDRFVRHGYDLAHELHLTMAQAALGTHLSFETLDGAEDLVIPRRHPDRAACSGCAAGASPTSRLGAGATCWSRWWSTPRPT